MRVGFEMDPTTLDPRKNGDPYTSNLHFLLYTGLTRISSNGEPELSLADSLEISNDETIYTFHLKEAYWSDGKPIVAADFVHSWKTSVSPDFGSVCPYLFYPIKNAEKAHQGEVPLDLVAVRALDERTLEVELENPTPYFLSLITFCNFFPVPEHIDLKDPLWATRSKPLVTSGPFLLSQWTRGKEITLTKNPSYWDASHVCLKKMTIAILPSASTAVQMFKNGEIDHLSTSLSSLEVEDLLPFKEKNELYIHPIGGLLFCTFNLERFPLQNRDLRHALSKAIQREALVSQITRLNEKPATRIIPPLLMNQQNRELFLPFDSKGAIESLEAALTDLKMDRNALSATLTLTYVNDQVTRKIAQTIQQQWQKVLGLNVELLEQEPKTLASLHMNKQYSLGLDRILVQYTDAYNVLERFKHKGAPKNYPGFENARYVEFLEEAKRASGANERYSLLEEAEKVLADELPIAPIYHFNRADLIDTRFEHITFSPLGRLLYEYVTVKN